MLLIQSTDIYLSGLHCSDTTERETDESTTGAQAWVWGGARVRLMGCGSSVLRLMRILWSKGLTWSFFCFKIPLCISFLPISPGLMERVFVLCRHIAVPPIYLSGGQTRGLCGLGGFRSRESTQEPGGFPVSPPTPEQVTIGPTKERESCPHQGVLVVGSSQASCG